MTNWHLERLILNWAISNYHDKDIKSGIIGEKSDAGGIAAGGISPANICSFCLTSPCATLLYMAGQ